MATDLTKDLDCYNLETLEKQALTKDCNDDIAKRVYDPCVLQAIQNLDPSSGGTPKTQTIFNVVIASADVEQSLVLPANVCGYFIKTRGKSTLKLTHTSGESGTLYLEVPANASYTDDNLYAALTLYFQSPNAGEVVEIITWT